MIKIGLDFSSHLFLPKSQRAIAQKKIQQESRAHNSQMPVKIPSVVKDKNRPADQKSYPQKMAGDQKVGNNLILIHQNNLNKVAHKLKSRLTCLLQRHPFRSRIPQRVSDKSCFLKYKIISLKDCLGTGN